MDITTAAATAAAAAAARPAVMGCAAAALLVLLLINNIKAPTILNKLVEGGGITPRKSTDSLPRCCPFANNIN